MNSVQTVTLNSALSQNWVRCTVRTPRTQVACTLRAVPMSWALLCVQQAGARSQGRSRAQRAQVAHIAPRSWAHVVTSFPCPIPGQVVTSLPGRDLLEDQARSQCQSHVATSLLPNQNSPSRDLKMGSRHQFP